MSRAGEPPAARAGIRAMPPYRPPLEGRRGLLRLDFNERVAPPHPAALEAIARLRPEDLAAYPEYGPYREKLAAHLGVRPEQVLPTNATDEAIQTVMLTYLEPGASVVLAEPTFAMFRVYAQIAGGRILSVPFRPDLAFPEEAYVEAWAPGDAALACLVDPNNPTATSLEPDQIARICAARPDRPVLCDEAYGAFTGRTAISLLTRCPNLIVSQTFSKAHGLAGLRIGHLVASAAVIRDLEKVRSPYSVNVAAVAAASALLDLPPEDEPGAYVREALRQRDRLAAAFRERGLPVRACDANFVLVDLGARAGGVAVGLRARGVLVRDRSRDLGLEGCVRVSAGDEQSMDRFLDAFDAAWREG